MKMQEATTLAKNTVRDIVRDFFAPAGIVINGNQPWDIHVECDKFYKRVLRDGNLGLGETYMDGWWECEKLDEFIFIIFVVFFFFLSF